MNKKTAPIYIAAAVLALAGIWLIVRANSNSKNNNEATNTATEQVTGNNSDTTPSPSPTPTTVPSTNTNTAHMTDATIKDKFVTLNVKGYGSIKLELFDEDAPKTVENFIKLAESGYYDGVSFHRVIPGFVVQGGDPTGTGAGGKSAFGADFADELNPNTQSYKTGYVKGTLAMANRGENTNSSQFFITLADLNQSLTKSYTIFGKVVSGMDIVDKIGAKGTPGGQPSEPIIIENAIVSDK